MIEAWCNNCGARFKVDDSMAGKSARCGRCKKRLQIPDTNPFAKPDMDEPVSLIGDDDEYDKLPMEATTVIEDDDGNINSSVILEAAANQDVISQLRRQRKLNQQAKIPNFWTRLPGCFVFMLKGTNLITLIALWLMASFGFAITSISYGAFTCFALLVVYGTACYMLFSVMLGSCNDEEKLVNMLNIGDYGDMFMSIFKIVFSILWTILPAIVISVAIKYTTIGTGLFTPSIVDLFTIPVCLVLFWPMTILILGTYGFDYMLLRHDVSVVNIYRTFGKYMAVSLSVLFCFAITVVTSELLPTGHSLNELLSSGGFAVQILCNLALNLIKIYCYLTMMRIIGIYYLCNHHKFTWDQ